MAKDGRTALMQASLGGHTEAMNALMAKGAEVNTAKHGPHTAEMGLTPLYLKKSAVDSTRQHRRRLSLREY